MTGAGGAAIGGDAVVATAIYVQIIGQAGMRDGSVIGRAGKGIAQAGEIGGGAFTPNLVIAEVFHQHYEDMFYGG